MTGWTMLLRRPSRPQGRRNDHQAREPGAGPRHNRKHVTFWTEAMQIYDTNVVGRVNPKKTGVEHLGVPIFASARHAAAEKRFDVTVMFIPPMAAEVAAIDACEAGATMIICLTEQPRMSWRCMPRRGRAARRPWGRIQLGS